MQLSYSCPSQEDHGCRKSLAFKFMKSALFPNIFETKANCSSFTQKFPYICKKKKNLKSSLWLCKISVETHNFIAIANWLIFLKLWPIFGLLLKNIRTSVKRTCKFHCDYTKSTQIVSQFLWKHTILLLLRAGFPNCPYKASRHHDHNHRKFQHPSGRPVTFTHNHFASP